MTSTETTRAQIVSRLGFFPPFFEPALDTPIILAELWRQTLVSYLDNPLPMIFKEKLAALLGRYCSVPYCLICYSASLHPLGMSATEVLALLKQAPPNLSDLAQSAEDLGVTPVTQWPESCSKMERAILNCCLAIFLKEDAGHYHEKLRLVLGKTSYDFLVIYIAYNRVCLTWAEAHPELSHEADQRAIKNLGVMLQDEPNLAQFFYNFKQRSQAQGDRRTRWLTLENKRLVDEERSLRLAAEEERNAKDALLNSTSEGIYGVDLVGRCTFINPAAMQMLRCTGADLSGLEICPRILSAVTTSADDALNK